MLRRIMTSSEKNHLDKILAFLHEIGINTLLETLPNNTFLPGLALRSGALVIDISRLIYVGDILHEAGHLACMPLEMRAGMTGVLPNNDIMQGGEMMAMAWSFAACRHLKLDAAVVFHEYGYKDESKILIEAYEAKHGPGIPLLQWLGMCYDERNAAQNGAKPFPHMLRWTCIENKYKAS